VEKLQPNPTEFIRRIKKALDLLSDFKDIRIISHYDADGITSAGIISKAFLREGKRLHVTLIKDLTSEFINKLKSEKYGACIFLDMGCGHIEELEEFSQELVICDHHMPIRESKKIQINPHFFRIDGTFECCASTIAYFVGKTISEKNLDTVGLALAGIIGDRQHIGGLRGLNREVAEEGIEHGFVTETTQLNMMGETLLDAITTSSTPFLKNISGRTDNASDFLRGLDIPTSARLEDLNESQKSKLISMVALTLLKQSVMPETIKEIVGKRYWLKNEKMDAEELSHYINSCGRLDKAGVGLSLCFGHKDSWETAKELRKEYKERIIASMLRLEKGISSMSNIQYFVSDDHSLAGALAGIGMLYLFDQEKPTIALTKVENTKISSRGTSYLVAKGLDLSKGLREASSVVGGSGGGHPIAAGATIPKGKEEEFLKILDGIVGEQLK
jgi:RecJ-like exonuclease